MKKGRKRHNNLTMPGKMFYMALPTGIMYLIFWILPLFLLLRYSFTNFDGYNSHDLKFVGLQHYKNLLQDGTVLTVLPNTLIYACCLVIGSNLIGMVLAFLLNSKIRGKGVYRTAAYIPTLFSAIVVGFVWTYVYMPNSGMIASILDAVGLDEVNFNILADFHLALYAIIIVDIWKHVGTTMIIYLAGLQTIDMNLVEAAKIDGCSAWQQIRYVKIPLLSATVTINVLLNLINGLKAYDYPFIMTSGGPGKSTQTLMYSVYRLSFMEQMMGKGAALSIISFVVIIIITIAMLIFMNKREVEL